MSDVDPLTPGATTEHVRLAAFAARIGSILIQPDPLRIVLQRCADEMVTGLDAALARIWTMDESGEGLILQASAGLYTHTDGPHGRLPVGDYKIGKIALDRAPHLTNAVQGDPHVHDQEWAREHALVAFAGYPLLVDDRLIGVMAMFSRHVLTDATLAAMKAVANSIAVGIERKRTEQALREEAHVRQVLATVGAALASELQRERVVQSITDAATALTTAEFGAFFYNVEEGGDGFLLAAVSGARKEAFEHFPYPRATELFGPTLRGEGVVRLDDMMKDLRFGNNPPHNGMPAGHFPVRSYLAVPVVSRGGELLGGLFFGHSRCGVFTARHEQFATGIASWAAVALDNAHLFAKAQEANRLKDEFLATLSHELRTPMNAILGWTKMLRERRLEPAMQQRALDIIERNARAQAQLIEDLLDVSRIVSGKLTVKSEPVNLSSVVAAAVETLRPEAAARGVTLGASVSATRTVVSGDADRLQQIVWNLLSNAIKFTPSGGRVQVTLQHADRQAEIVVSDSGQGIAREFLPHAFDRFRQADSTSGRHHGGLGLGLSIVQHLTQAHGGTVVAASEGEGKGATFTVRLPLLTGKDADERAPATVAASRTLEGVRVLVVDDEPDARSLLAYGLSAAGADVTQVSSAGEALRAFTERGYNVLLSDLAMPGHDGYWLIRAIRAASPERGGTIPAIAVTAYSGPRERDLALAAGYNWHVTKPVDLELVKAIVGELITEQHVEAALGPESSKPAKD